jgi:hypothetical protein
MRYRLTKRQIEMLLDGKKLFAGNRYFELHIDDASREKITKLMEVGELPGKYALFIDDKEPALYLEDAK